VLAEPPIVLSKQDSNHGTIQSRLRAQMQADALRPLDSALDEDTPGVSLTAKSIFTPETIDEATHFLRLGVRDTYCGHSNVLKRFIGPGQTAAGTCLSSRQVCVLLLVWDTV
jgi:hypothetical protein